MADKTKKRERQNLIVLYNVATWKSNVIKATDNSDGSMSSTFQRISVFDSAAGQMYLFLCIYNKLTIMEKLKSLGSFYIYIFYTYIFLGYLFVFIFLYLAQSNKLFKFVPLPCSGGDSARQCICIMYLY